jgi:hypothetical protein
MFHLGSIFGFSSRFRASLVLLLWLCVCALGGYLGMSADDASQVVQRVLQKYTGPTVAVGAPVREMRAALGVAFDFAPGLGYVTHLSDSTGVSELRLLLPTGQRTRVPGSDDRAAAVEILTTSRDAFSTLVVEVSAFFRDPPHEGCLRMTRPGEYREVRYWEAPLRRGGIAITNGFGGSASASRHEPDLVGLLAFAGRFRGSETMRGDYVPQPCATASHQTVSRD